MITDFSSPAEAVGGREQPTGKPTNGNALPFPSPLEPEADQAEDFANLKIRFLAVLNHEIRTPLSGIMGMTDLLLESSLDDEQREYVSATRSCAETLFEVLNATLEYSSLSSGRVRLEEAEWQVREVVSTAIAEHVYKAESKGLKLHSVIEPEVPEIVLGDAMRVRQILSHLVSNAVKFTPQGEVEIRVSVVEANNGSVRLQFRVRDTGIGIAAEQLAHIFDSFRQLDSGLSRAYTGLGLGLALVERLAALMKGKIWAQSSVGEGSSFFVEIPFATNDMHPVTSASPEPETEHAARILLVEDNEVAQRIFSHVLKRGKYLVECASSGQEAVNAASNRRYDLILMDLQMPGMHGVDATNQIRAKSMNESTPIIALTANTGEEHRRMCLESGMVGFLTKPIPSEELLAAVGQFLN
ncbi:MAG: response regulator [Candidatus Solibacter usitatus]|nr:response regulator [Candidatus Solibacter usitatus]